MIPALPLAAAPAPEAVVAGLATGAVPAPPEGEDAQPFGEALALAVLAAQAQPLPRPLPTTAAPPLAASGSVEAPAAESADPSAPPLAPAMTPSLPTQPYGMDAVHPGPGRPGLSAPAPVLANVPHPVVERPPADRLLAMLRPTGAAVEAPPPPPQPVAQLDAPAPPPEPVLPAPPPTAAAVLSPGHEVEPPAQPAVAMAAPPEVAGPEAPARALEVARVIAALELAAAPAAAGLPAHAPVALEQSGPAGAGDPRAVAPAGGAAPGLTQALATRRPRPADRAASADAMTPQDGEPEADAAPVPSGDRGPGTQAAARPESAHVTPRPEAPRGGQPAPAPADPALVPPQADHAGTPGERDHAPGDVGDVAVGDAAAAASPPVHRAEGAPPALATGGAALSRAPATAPDVAAPRPAPEPAAHQPAVPTGHTTQLAVPLHDEGGGQAQLRVSVRGDSVRATIVAADAISARRMEAALGELRQSLAERGYADAKLTVVAPRPAAEALPAWAPPMTAGLPAAEAGSSPAGQERHRSEDQQGHRSWTERHSHQRSPRERRKEEQ